MPKFRKKPVVIEAMRWMGRAEGATPVVDWILSGGGTARYHNSTRVLGEHIAVDTLEGTMRTEPGDWIIRGVQDEFYPCKPDIFDATYEPVD